MKRRENISRVLGVLLLASTVLAPALSGAVELDLFVKVDGIPGESQDKFHKDWIEAVDYGDGILVTTTSGGRSASKPSFDPIKIGKAIDMASPKLRLVAASGTHIKQVVLEFVKNDESRGVLWKIELSDVVIAEVSAGANASSSGELDLREVVAFSFRKIQWTYYVYDSSGKQKGTVKAGWDLGTNKPVAVQNLPID